MSLPGSRCTDAPRPNQSSICLTLSCFYPTHSVCALHSSLLTAAEHGVGDHVSSQPLALSLSGMYARCVVSCDPQTQPRHPSDSSPLKPSSLPLSGRFSVITHPPTMVRAAVQVSCWVVVSGVRENVSFTAQPPWQANPAAPASSGAVAVSLTSRSPLCCTKWRSRREKPQ